MGVGAGRRAGVPRQERGLSSAQLGKAARSVTGAAWQTIKFCTALQDELHQADYRLRVVAQSPSHVGDTRERGDALPCDSFVAALDQSAHHWESEGGCPEETCGLLLRTVFPDGSAPGLLRAWDQHQSAHQAILEAAPHACVLLTC